MAPGIEAVYAALEVQLGSEVVAQLYATLGAVLRTLEAAPQDADSVDARR
jgi:hypothetical protein